MMSTTAVVEMVKEVEVEEEVASLPEVDMAASEVEEEEEAVVVEEEDTAIRKIEVDTETGQSSPLPSIAQMTPEVVEVEEEEEVAEEENGT